MIFCYENVSSPLAFCVECINERVESILSRGKVFVYSGAARAHKLRHKQKFALTSMSH
jgi:hypothetical protein